MTINNDEILDPTTRYTWRRGTAARWIEVNPVLRAGEPGYETDTGLSKVGDGLSIWSALDYTSIVYINTLLDYLQTGSNYVDAAAAAAGSAAASATSAAASAELAQLLTDIATTDDAITAIDLDETSDFRVQQDARHKTAQASNITNDAGVQDALTARVSVDVPSASTTTPGRVELATDAEATAGTDASRAVTPAAAQAAIDARRVTYLPETYGAVGDGTTNDSTAWQSLLTAIGNAGGRGRIQLDGTKTYLVADLSFTSAIVDVVVDGRGATIKSKATPSSSTTIRVGATTVVGRLKFVDVTFDDNSAGRPAEDLVQIALTGYNYVGFFGCRFINMEYHHISTYGALLAGSAGRTVVERCEFDGASVSATGSHIYASNTGEWTITNSTFANIGNSGVSGGHQAIYAAGCNSLTMSGCTFRNCGQAWDLRSVAYNVTISGCLIVGGVNGSGNSSSAGNVTVATDDAVMSDITITNSYHPIVLRVSSGNRCTFTNWTYRAGANSPAGQRFARLAGSGHKFISPDLKCQAVTSSTAAVFDLSDQPTNVDIVGGVLEDGVRVFRYATAQATVAVRLRGTILRGQVATWINSVSTPGSTAVAAIEMGSSYNVKESATLDFPSIAASSSQSLTIALPGAVVGNPVACGPAVGIEAGLVWNGFVSAADTVTVRVTNVTGAAIDPASATWNVAIVK